MENPLKFIASLYLAATLSILVFTWLLWLFGQHESTYIAQVKMCSCVVYTFLSLIIMVILIIAWGLGDT